MTNLAALKKWTSRRSWAIGPRHVSAEDFAAPFTALPTTSLKRDNLGLREQVKLYT